MAPKRKKAAAASSSKKKKAEEPALAEPEPEAAPAPALAPKKSPAKTKPLASKTVSELWNSEEYVQGGKMTQEGFALFCEHLSIEGMSLEGFYLTFRLSPNQSEVADAMIVCASKHAMQTALDGLGCKSLGDLPAKLKAKCSALQHDFGRDFAPFFRWLFEMGKAISALNHDLVAANVRTVPLAEGLGLMEVALARWPLLPSLKAFCEDKFAQPFSKDLWTQIGRFVHMTATGQIAPDLSNYDDEASGGGSAWPCAIDEFVEHVQSQEGGGGASSA